MALLTRILFIVLLQLSFIYAEAQEKGTQQSGSDYVVLHDSLLTGDLREVHLSELKGWKFIFKNNDEIGEVFLIKGYFSRVIFNLRSNAFNVMRDNLGNLFLHSTSGEDSLFIIRLPRTDRDGEISKGKII